MREGNFLARRSLQTEIQQEQSKKDAQGETNSTKINLNNEEDGWQRIAGSRICNFIHILHTQGDSSNDKTILMLANYFPYIAWPRFLLVKFPHPRHVSLEICSFRSFILDLRLSTLRFHFTAAELFRSLSFGQERFPCQGKGGAKNRPQRQKWTRRVGEMEKINSQWATPLEICRAASGNRRRVNRMLELKCGG